MNMEQLKYEQAIGQMERCYAGCGMMNSENREFIDFVIAALRAQQERENPQPLSLEQLRERVGKPVWLVITDEDIGKYSGWSLVIETVKTMGGLCWYFECVDTCKTRNIEEYGKTWIAYVHEPKEARG